ncbi:MAG: TIGR00269 family protein [Candidatus Helarchaeota archaeon]
MSCTGCKKRDFVYYRKYSGEKYCKKCFCTSIEKKVARTISKYKMLAPTDRVLIGLSGGKDSVVLTYLLNEIEKRFPNSKLLTVTIDEGIKNYREESIRIVQKITKDWNLENKIYRFKDVFGYTIDEIKQIITERKLELLPCTFCGVFRRKVLNLAARELNADKLAVGFNLDDEAQTILMNFIRGDLSRITRISPSPKKIHKKFVPRIRPLREIYEKEIVLYAYFKSLPIQSKECPYAFNSLRHNVQAAINLLEEKSPNVKYNLLRNTESLSKIYNTSDLFERKPIYECSKCGEPTSATTCKACELLSIIEKE